MKRPSVKRLFRFPSRTRDEIAADVEDEIQLHLEMRIDELQSLGLQEDEAREQASREFGDRSAATRDGLRHEHSLERQHRFGRLLAEFRQDLRLGVRLLARSPGFTAAAVLTLAVAIGGNTAIFSVANALLFKPVPVTAPHELARVRPGASQMSWPNYRDFEDRTSVFSDLVAHRRLRVAMSTADGLPTRLNGEQTSLNFFRTLGVAPALGRTFSPADARRDLAVLADHTWRSRFGADAGIVGRVLRLGGQPYEVIGVMPAGFRGVAPAGFLTDAWFPVDDEARNAMLRDRQATRFEVFGRLKPAATHAQAAGAMAVTAQQIRAEHRELGEALREMEVFPVDGIGAFRGMGDLVIPVFLFLGFMTVVATAVLLIGCANIAGLLIGRAAARQREVAVRLALGAGRGRLIRQLLTESLVLALMGGVGGVLLAIWLTGAVNVVLARTPIPMAFDLHLDQRIALYALALSAVTAVVFGLAPARRAARFDLVSSLKEGANATPGRQRLRRMLVVGQVAACSALLVWSGLFSRSLGNITDVDPGFDPDGVLLARIEFDDLAHDAALSEQALVAMQQRAQDHPAVESVGLSTVVPLSLENEEFDAFAGGADGTPPQVQRVMANRLTPGWFETVRIPIVAGRDFTWADRPGAPDVAIVNATLARRFWNGDALGKSLGVSGRSLQVVGVVRDSKYWTLGESPQPTVYLPFQQHYFRYVTFHVRTADRQAVTALFASEMRRMVPDIFVDFSPMADVMTVAMLPTQVGAATTGAFGILAMLLAALGVYGLVAFNVAQRRGEISVRKVVGAGTADVVRLVVAENLTLTGIGLGAGLCVGTLGGTLLRAFLTGVSPLDGVTLLGAGLVVTTAAVAATALPAIRAARVSPLGVLRDA
jgi:predicted permease